MNQSETAQILTLISQYNGMTVDKARALAWHDMIGDLGYNDVVEAVKHHFRTSKEWVQPGHLLDGVKALQAARDARQISVRRVVVEDPELPGYVRGEIGERSRSVDFDAAQSEYSEAKKAALDYMRSKTAPTKSSVIRNRETVRYMGPGLGGSVSKSGEPERLGPLLRVVPVMVKPMKEDAA